MAGRVQVWLVAGLALSLALPGRLPAALYPAQQPPWITLVEEGQPRCEVRISSEPSKAEKHGANELAAYLEQISGAKVPVVASDGPASGLAIVVTTDPALSEETLVMESGPQGVRLGGGGPRGVVYACYAFLEECLGVRWYMPDELGQVVPRSPTIRVGTFHRRESPAMRIRWVGRDEWALRNRMNVLTPVSELKVWHRGHSFDAIIPPDRYFSAHPEFFAYNSEKKTRVPRQLCTSNPQLVAELIKNLRAGLDADPEVKIVGLSPNDGTGFCECPDCRALDEESAGRPSVLDVNRRYVQMGPERRGALSRRLIVFDNLVADALAQSHPGVLVKSFVYNAYLQPPADANIRCARNLLIEVCHNTCHGHAYGEAPCPPNAGFCDFLAGWRRIADQVMLYEYYHKGGAMGLPWGLVHTIRRDLPYAQKIGLVGLYTQYRPMPVVGLNFYLAAKLAWNPNADVDALLADWYEGLYGRAATPIRQMQEMLEQTMQRSKLHPCGSSDMKYLFLADFYPKEVTQRCRQLLDAAKTAAADPDTQKRIAARANELTYAELMCDYFLAARQAGEAPADEQAQQRAVARQRAEAVRRFLRSPEGKSLSAGKIDGVLKPESIIARLKADMPNAW